MSSTKPASNEDSSNAIRYAFNDVNRTIGVDSFIVGQVGRKITASYPDSVTEVYSYYEGTTLLYAITVIYEDSTKALLSSAERTA